MGAVAEWFIGTKTTPAQVGLIAFLGDIAILVFDNVGTGDFKGAIGEWGNDHWFAHIPTLVPQVDIARSPRSS